MCVFLFFSMNTVSHGIDCRVAKKYLPGRQVFRAEVRSSSIIVSEDNASMVACMCEFTRLAKMCLGTW